METVAVVLGAGRGQRLGAGIPKAYVCLAGRSLLEWSAAALGAVPGIDAVLPVVASADDDAVGALTRSWRGPARLLDAVPGGATRQGSLGRGLAAVASAAPRATWVAVHDAARCLVEAQDVLPVLAAARDCGAAIPVLPVTDTLKSVRAERVVGTVERASLVRVLTPQVFRLALLREALEKAERDGFEGTDCASLVERLGAPVATCAGRPDNFKVTEPADLARAEALLRARSGA
jgi:2-C-methyl-D-erythritol 4-phosphate cytidylyltransferase